MTTYLPAPLLLQVVEHASKREAARTRAQLRRGLPWLAAIAMLAVPLGSLSACFHLLFDSFPPIGTSRTTGTAFVAGAVAHALYPAALGLAVAILARILHERLDERLQSFELEMQLAIRGLTSQLAPWIHTIPLPAKPQNIQRGLAPDLREPAIGPIPRIYRYGLLELISPRLHSLTDAQDVLARAMRISFLCAFIGWFVRVCQDRIAEAWWVAIFFVAGGLAIRCGSRVAPVCLACYLASALFTDVVEATWAPVSVCIAAAPLFLWGARPAAKKIGRRLPLVEISLIACTILACAVTVLGYALTIELTGDGFVVGTNQRFMGTIHVGDPVQFSYRTRRVLRVAGLPGDKIEVREGILMRNGRRIFEPLCKLPVKFDESLDFPVSSQTLPSSNRRWWETGSYFRVSGEGPYRVPEGTVFLLNDDRNDLDDSRAFGPVYQENLTGRPLFALGF